MKIPIKVDVKKFIEYRDFKTLKKLIQDQEPASIVDMLEELPPTEKLIIFRLLPKDTAAEVFSELEPDEQLKLIQIFKDETLKSIFENLDPDDRTELLEEMPANVVSKLLEFLSPEERRAALDVLNYPEDSAGRLMTPEYVSIRVAMTAKKALEHVRSEGRDKETIYTLFAVDETRKLLGIVELKDLIFAEEKTLVKNIMDPNPVHVSTTDTQEDVAAVMKKYDLISVPVVDSDDRLVGIITVDDIIDVIDEEATEDIHHMASMSATETSYFHTPWWTFVKNRLPWVLGLMLFESLSGEIVRHFQSMIIAFPIMTAFITTMSSTGGNTGSQISALVIRGMALGEIQKKDWWRVLLKELIIASVIGISAGTLLFFRAFLLSNNLFMNFSVALAVAVIALYADTLGATMPFIGRLFKIDPAMMSGPLLATFVDVSGIAIYLMIVSAIAH